MTDLRDTDELDQWMHLAARVEQRPHPCPGCGTLLWRRYVGCETCWTNLPTPDRNRLREAFRSRETDPIGYAKAVSEATALIIKHNPPRGKP